MRCSPPRCSPGSSRWSRGSAPSGLRNLVGVRAALRGAGERVPPADHGRVPAREPARRRGRAAARSSRSRPTRLSPSPGEPPARRARCAAGGARGDLVGGGVSALAVARAVVAPSSARRGRPVLHRVAAARGGVVRPVQHDRVGRDGGRRARRLRGVRALGRALRARVGGGADRHGTDARDDRLRAAVAGGAPVRRRGALVAAAPSPDAHRLLLAHLRELARARLPVRLPLPRARDRDGARAAARRLVVAAGRAGVRRCWRRCPRS